MLDERFIRARVVVVTAAAALLFAACSDAEQASRGGDDKAGGSAGPVVLTMADTYSGFHYEPAVQYFVDRVEEISGGSLQIDVTHEYGAFAADAEQQVVAAVASGEFDIAWVGTRVFDTLGVTSFQALTAPMLIDSYPLQHAVVASDIPNEMLAGLDEVGVTGITVLADGLRKPIAVERPLLGPADFDGITFQAFRSNTQAEAIRALGAEPIEVWSGGLDAGLRTGEVDGFEKSLHIYNVNATSFLAPYVTANVNLWPQTAAIIANPKATDDLSEQQRDWLMQAGADAAEHSTDLVDDDAELVVQLCEAGSRFANASDADIDALHQAFVPVYAALDQDPQTKQFIEQIGALKQTTDPGPALNVPPDCIGLPDSGDTDSAGTTPTAVSDETANASLNGTYRWTVTEEDARANGDPRLVTADQLPWYPMIGTMTLDEGDWVMVWRGDHGAQITDGPGTYTIDGDQIVLGFPQDPVGSLVFTFSIDDDGNIDVEPVLPMAEDAQFVFSYYVWEKIDGGAGTDHDEPTLPDGAYRRQVSEDELIDAGIDARVAREEAGLYTLTLDNGTFLLNTKNDFDLPNCEGTYSRSGTQVTFVNTTCGGGEFFTATWMFDGNELRFENVGAAPLIVTVVGGQPWRQISGGEVNEAADPAALNGTYRWTLTEADALEHGPASLKTPEELAAFPYVQTVVLEDGIWSMVVGGYPPECDTDDCTYVVDGDRIVFDWPKARTQLESTFTSSGDLQPAPAACSPDERRRPVRLVDETMGEGRLTDTR